MGQIWIIWDLAALLILAGCIFFAARAGFVRTLISFFAYVVAAVAANILSRPAAVWMYDTFLGDFIKGILTGSLRETLAKDGGALQFAENAPVWLRGAFGLVPEEMLNAMDLSQNAARAVDTFVESSLREGIVWLLGGIVFFFSFLILVVIVKQIAKLFTFVDKIPLIGTLNTALGGVLGAVEAVIILCVIAVFAHAFVMLSGDLLPVVNSTVFEKSFLMRFFYNMTAF
jgi:uncharacterized membrane protein required for colicin V production